MSHFSLGSSSEAVTWIEARQRQAKLRKKILLCLRLLTRWHMIKATELVVLFQLSQDSHWTVVRNSPRCHYAVVDKLPGSHQGVIARTYLQPHYNNVVFGNVYLSV